MIQNTGARPLIIDLVDDITHALQQRESVGEIFLQQLYQNVTQEHPKTKEASLTESAEQGNA
jgi:hypothetical protein